MNYEDSMRADRARVAQIAYELAVQGNTRIARLWAGEAAAYDARLTLVVGSIETTGDVLSQTAALTPCRHECSPTF